MHPVPRNETKRLAKLRSLALDDQPEPALERVVQLAARHFAMPMAAVWFVDEHRVWCKAGHGLKLKEASRQEAICAHTIMQKSTLVATDLRADRRFECCVFDVGTESIRFYAGAPLRTPDGCALGTLCVMDTSPREFTGEDEQTLADMAAMVIDGLNLRRAKARLEDEVRRGRQSRRALARQGCLLQRLSASQDEQLRLRAAESTRLNAALQDEIAGRKQADTALKEAEKANAAKSDFMLRMSHELRTPLNAILGFGQILQGTVAPEAQRSCATHVVTAGRHLLSLINEVLDITRIEAGRLDLSLEPVDVQNVVREVLDLIRPLADERRITLVSRGNGGPGPVVFADRQRLKQVLLNFLSNAVKYSPEGGQVAVQRRTERGRTLRLSVSDNGPGISREQAGRLFVAFERLGAEHSGVPGIGLGLALSKRLVEAMHGKIGACANKDRGSTFWVQLPLDRETICTSADACPEACLASDGPPFINSPPTI